MRRGTRQRGGSRAAGTSSRKAQPRQASPVGKLNQLRAAGKERLIRLSKDAVKNPDDFLDTEGSPAAVDAAEASFSKVEPETTAAKSPRGRMIFLMTKR